MEAEEVFCENYCYWDSFDAERDISEFFEDIGEEDDYTYVVKIFRKG